ncbi:hypothetical protein DMENIID0001_025160 [Sergentomyia squamirostris]
MVETDCSEFEERHESGKRRSKSRHVSSGKKDTGYSTASSQTTPTMKSNDESHRISRTAGGRTKRSNHRNDISPSRSSKSRRKHTIDNDKKHSRRCDSTDNDRTRGRRKHRRDAEPLKEEDSKSNASEDSIHFKAVNEKKSKKKQKLSLTSDSETSPTQ